MDMTTGLTSNETLFLTHMSRYGGYRPIHKYGRKWGWVTFCGVGGSPTLYKTKRAALQAVDQFIDSLMAKEVNRTTYNRITETYRLLGYTENISSPKP